MVLPKTYKLELYVCIVTNLKTYLVQRGYDDEEVQFQLNKASAWDEMIRTTRT